MAQSKQRPLSPHLSIWKWGPHMTISILHRVTGSGLAIVGAIVLVWWLMAAATGRAAYETFMTCAKSPFGYVVMIGLTWSFFQHLLSGLRHFVLDMGAGYELQVNKSWSMLIFFLAIAFTAILWLVIFSGTL
ncbi:succinate dehydrogenase, cytochrome b556 subunit [soil metagenome]